MLEPELSGSIDDPKSLSMKFKSSYGFDNVHIFGEDIQKFTPSDEKFDIVLMLDSINHLNEESVVHLHQKDSQREREEYKKILSKIDLSKVDLNDLTLVQSVQPARRYKTNMDGSISTFGKRAKALEDLLGKPIRNRMKFKFVVTKKPLPGISKPSKSSVKPIDYMYPIDLLEDKNDVDLNWYKKMIENYVQGAFGLSDIIFTEQRELDSWM